MFDIGFQELILIFVIALLVFGPKSLPQLGRTIGRVVRQFREATEDFRETIEEEMEMDEPPAAPSTAPAAEVPAPPAPAPEPAAEPAAAVAETAEDAGPPPGEPYLAQRGARLFHARECGWVRRIAEPDRVYFKRVAEAREAGLVACPTCEPWEPG